MWLMGYVLFCSTSGNVVPKHYLAYARHVADAPMEEVARFSWGSTVLAATYRGLCMTCMKSSAAEPMFVGCPLLLQLWAHERFQIGRPLIDPEPYTNFPHDDIDGPTMGAFWCNRRVRQ